MRACLGYCGAILLVLVAAAACAAQEPPAKDHHPWGKFRPGAWKKLRLVTQSYQDRKLISTTTQETTATLLEVTADEYALRLEVTVEVAGKRFTHPPQTIRRRLLGDTNNGPPTVKKLGNETLTIHSRVVATEVFELTSSGDLVNRTLVMRYSPEFFPYVLQQNLKAESSDGSVTLYETQQETLAFNMPFKVLTEIHDAAFVRTLHRKQDETTVTMEVHSESVPGGVVSHSAKKLDASQVVIEQSTLELVDYGFADNEEPARRNRRFFSRGGRE